MATRSRSKVTPQGPKVELRRVRVDRQGYDENGRYWGVGPPLFMAEDAEDYRLYAETFRATDRETAKDRVRRKYRPDVRF